MAVQSRIDVVVRRLELSGEPKAIDNATILQSSAAIAGSVTDTTSYPVADQDTLTEKITIDGGTEQTVTFAGATTTALQVAAQINAGIIGGSANVVGGQVVITSDSVGSTSSVAIGTGTTALTWAAAVAGTGYLALADKTVMAQDPATEKWVPLTDVTATDGTEFPRGYFSGDAISAADLAAGDVDDQIIVVGGPVTVDEDLLVFQNSVALSDEITNQNITVRSALTAIGIFPEATNFISGVENT